jgi:hypothetical protein
MEINITADMETKDITDIFSLKLKENGIDSTSGKFVIQAFSDKKNEFVEVKDVKISFVKVRVSPLLRLPNSQLSD